MSSTADHSAARLITVPYFFFGHVLTAAMPEPPSVHDEEEEKRRLGQDLEKVLVMVREIVDATTKLTRITANQSLRWFVDNFALLAEWRAALSRVIKFREMLLVSESGCEDAIRTIHLMDFRDHLKSRNSAVPKGKKTLLKSVSQLAGGNCGLNTSRALRLSFGRSQVHVTTPAPPLGPDLCVSRAMLKGSNPTFSEPPSSHRG
jgi:hypothetical protein